MHSLDSGAVKKPTSVVTLIIEKEREKASKEHANHERATSSLKRLQQETKAKLSNHDDFLEKQLAQKQRLQELKNAKAKEQLQLSIMSTKMKQLEK